MNEPLIGNIPGTRDDAARKAKGDAYRANYDSIFRRIGTCHTCVVESDNWRCPHPRIWRHHPWKGCSQWKEKP